VLDFKLGQQNFTTEHHNKIVSLTGEIGFAKQVTPELITAKFKCEHCGELIDVPQGGGRCKLLKPENCSNKRCETKPNKFTFIPKNSVFTNYQEIWLKPFKTPMYKLGKGQKIILRKGLVDAKEGEKISVTGKLSFELKGRTTFAIPVVLATKIKRLD
jgi:DNA replicative helicase MCM subunit Mcm2 (Cdc46/Mcm family)